MSRRATLGGLSQSTLNIRGGGGVGGGTINQIGGGAGGGGKQSRQSLGPPQISETMIKTTSTMNNNSGRRPSNPRSSSAGMGQRYLF